MTWLTKFEKVVRARTPGKWFWDSARQTIVSLDYEIIEGSDFSLLDPDIGFIALSGAVADEVLELVYCVARLEATEGGYGADERWAQLKEALAKLAEKVSEQ